MSRRPGHKKEWGAGCLAIFALPFAAFGVGALIGGVRGLAQGKWGEAIGLTLFGLIFSGVGFGMIGFGVHSVRKHKQEAGGGSDHFAVPVDWRQSKLFPKAPKVKDNRAEGVALQPDLGRLGKSIGLLVATLFWNGIVWAAVTAIVTQRKKDGIEWIILVFVSVFALIGIGLAVATVHQFLRYLMVGETSVEIDEEPLRPGQATRLRLRQKGDFEIAAAKIVLLCKEQVQYRQGTDTVTVNEVVHEETIAEEGGLMANNTAPIMSVDLKIPSDAPHSFKASDNKILWIVKVTMDLPGRPDVDEEFVLRVAPELVPASGEAAR